MPEIVELILIKTHLSREFGSNAWKIGCSSRCNGRGPEFRDHSQDVGEEIFGNGDFSHLKRDIAAMAHDFRADLDQLLFAARQ